MNASAGAPPHLVITDDVRGPNLWITTLLALALCTVSLAARATVKSRFRLKRYPDDWLLALGYVLVVIQCALIITALTKNFGTKLGQIPEQDVGPIEKYFFAAQIVFVVAVYFPKLAMIHLLRSVFTIRSRLLILQGATGAAGLASLLAVAAGCRPHPGYVAFVADSRCSNRLARWVVIVVFDILTEIAIIGSCAYFLRDIQMRTDGKIKVMLAVSSRIACVAFALLFIISWSEFLHSSEPGTAIILPAVYQQCNISISVMLAATLPCFRILFQSSEVIDYPLNPYALRAQQMQTSKTTRNEAPPGEVGNSEKLKLGKQASSSTGADSVISKARTLTF